jgi:hypothetical protein
MIYVADVVRAALQLAEEKIKKLPTPRPAELRFQVAKDQTGEDAVWVAMIFADETPEDEILAALPRITKTIEDAVHSGFTNMPLDVTVYAMPFRRATAPWAAAS